MKCRVCGTNNCTRKIAQEEITKFLEWAYEDGWDLGDCLDFKDDYFEEETITEECSDCNEECPVKKE